MMSARGAVVIQAKRDGFETRLRDGLRAVILPSAATAPNASAFHESGTVASNRHGHRLAHWESSRTPTTIPASA